MGKKKFKKKFIVIPLICAIVIGGVAYAINMKKQADSIVQVVPVSEMMSDVYFSEISSCGKVTKGSMQSVRAVKDSEIKVSKYNVKKGDTVKKGDVLLEYDTESLQMELETQKTQLSVAENNIKIQENNIKNLKGLQPSENATQPTEPETQPETEPLEEPTTPIEPLENIEYLKRVDIDTQPLDGDGSEENPYIFFVSADSVVSSRYMKFLSKGDNGNPIYAIFNVCTDDEGLVYSWLVNGLEITKEYIKDWQPVNGVSRAEDGSIRVKQGENPFATLITYSPNTTQDDREYIENQDIYEMLGDDLEIDDELVSSYLEDNNALGQTQNAIVDDVDDTAKPTIEGADYFYSREELKELIADAENQLEELKFSKRQLEIEIKRTENSLKTGKEIATIDGVVTFSANSNEQAVKKGYHIVISNESTTSIMCTLSSEDLKSVFVGTKVSVSYFDGSAGANNAGANKMDSATCEGEVSEISDVPTVGTNESYDSRFVDDTSENYEVKIVLDKSIQIDNSEEIFVSFDVGEAQKNGVWIPYGLIRSENKKHYVFVANDKNVLEKRYIEKGVTYWGQDVEILSGLSKDDKIAFPYGNAKEGMDTLEVDYSTFTDFSGIIF